MALGVAGAGDSVATVTVFVVSPSATGCREFVQGTGFYGAELDDGVNEPVRSTVEYADQATGAWIIIAVHSSVLGPASGGTRMKSYPSLAEAVADAHKLGQSMTYKFAVAGMPRGGPRLAGLALVHEV